MIAPHPFRRSPVPLRWRLRFVMLPAAEPANLRSSLLRSKLTAGPPALKGELNPPHRGFLFPTSSVAPLIRPRCLRRPLHQTANIGFVSRPARNFPPCLNVFPNVGGWLLYRERGIPLSIGGGIPEPESDALSPDDDHVIIVPYLGPTASLLTPPPRLAKQKKSRLYPGGRVSALWCGTTFAYRLALPFSYSSWLPAQAALASALSTQC